MDQKTQIKMLTESGYYEQEEAQFQQDLAEARERNAKRLKELPQVERQEEKLKEKKFRPRMTSYERLQAAEQSLISKIADEALIVANHNMNFDREPEHFERSRSRAQNLKDMLSIQKSLHLLAKQIAFEETKIINGQAVYGEESHNALLEAENTLKKLGIDMPPEEE